MRTAELVTVSADPLAPIGVYDEVYADGDDSRPRRIGEPVEAAVGPPRRPPVSRNGLIQPGTPSMGLSRKSGSATPDIAYPAHKTTDEQEGVQRPFAGPGAGRRQLDERAFHGLVGRVVRTLEPHTEADSVGLVLTFLAAFGAAVGNGAHALADGAEHPARLFVVLVGTTSKGRKGTTWQQIRRVLVLADPTFVAERILNGFGSGEAVVDAAAEGEDHRLFVVEPEWGRLLAVARREGSTISPLLRQAWDGDRLAVRSRAGKAVADGAHVVVLGHVTAEELRSKLLDVEVANGYANRHLFCEVRRSKLLPSGGNLDEAEVARLGQEVGDAASPGPCHRRPAPHAGRGGAMGRALPADGRRRARRHSGRPDRSRRSTSAPPIGHLRIARWHRQIDLPHIEAAWAVWRYCRSSVAAIFGDRTGDPVADRLLDAARRAGPSGLTTDEQHGALGRHVPAPRLRVARDLLVSLGSALVRQVDTGGRRAEVLIARDCEEGEKSEKRAGARPLPSHSSLLSHDWNGAPPVTDADIARWGAEADCE